MHRVDFGSNLLKQTEEDNMIMRKGNKLRLRVKWLESELQDREDKLQNRNTILVDIRKLTKEQYDTVNVLKLAQSSQ